MLIHAVPLCHVERSETSHYIEGKRWLSLSKPAISRFRRSYSRTLAVRPYIAKLYSLPSTLNWHQPCRRVVHIEFVFMPHNYRGIAVAVVANWATYPHRNIVFARGLSHNHLGSLSELRFALLHVGHLPNHKSVYLLHHAREDEVLHHSVDIIYILTNILQKQNCALGVHIDGRATQRDERSEVPANKSSLSATRHAAHMSVTYDRWDFFARNNIEDAIHIGVVHTKLSYAFEHRAMNRLTVAAYHGRVNDRNI